MTEDTIKLGVILDMTGPGAGIANITLNGVRDWFRYVNDEGGVNGRKVKLLVEDDRYSIPAAIAAFKKLVCKDKVAIMIGPGSTGAITVLWRSFQKEKMPIVCAPGVEVNINPSSGISLQSWISILTR